MMSDDSENLFDTSGFERRSAGFVQLQHRLPESAVQVLAREVIARMAQRKKSLTDSLQPLDEVEIETFCNALIGRDPDLAVKHVMRLRAEGLPVEQIYLGALAPAARCLGKWWDEDRASFAEVTIGISRIYGIMYGLRAEFPVSNLANQRTAVFASIPGEDHTLGVSMAADLFRKEGWDVDLKLGMDHHSLVRDIAETDPPVIGLSVGREEALPALTRLIVALRVSNPRAYILVAGRFVPAHVETLLVAGADTAASDIPEALEEMEKLWLRATVDTANARR